MPPTNLEATVMVLDIGVSVSKKDKYEPLSFFEKSCSCVMRIVERKILSRPNDLIGLIVMGSKVTNNDLDDEEHFQNISVATNLENPTWRFIELLAKKVKTTDYQADWLDALMVAASYLKDQLGIKKTSHRKIVLMSDLKRSPRNLEGRLQQVIDAFTESVLELIVIGPDIWDDDEFSEPTKFQIGKTDEQLKSEVILKKIISETDTITCSFEEAIRQLMYHKKKVTAPQAWNVDLCIGPDVRIPVSGYGRIRDNKSSVKFQKALKKPSNRDSSDTTVSSIFHSIINEKKYYKKDDNTVLVDDLDIISGYSYGQTIVPFSKLDKAMEYESGPRCLNVIGFTKMVNIHWNDLAGDGLTHIYSRKDIENAKTALDALVMAVSNLGLVAIARKVYNKNNAPSVVVLFPIKENNLKYFSMIELAFKEDYKQMVFPSIQHKKYLPDEEQIKAMDSLIDSMDLTLGDETDEPYLPENTVNPSLQHTLDTLTHRALHPDEPMPQPRPEVLQMLQVPEHIMKLNKEPLEIIKNKFELSEIIKVKSGRHWVNEQLKLDDEDMVIDIVPSRTSVTDSSVVTDRVTKVGTVQPAEDFVELLGSGEPIDMVCEQLFEVVEKLVLLAFGDDYFKPIKAIRTMRVECMGREPTVYNNWLTDFKCVLLERSKNSFFKLLLDNNLSLITAAENPASDVNEDDIQRFASCLTELPISNPVEMDTTDIDDFFG